MRQYCLLAACLVAACVDRAEVGAFGADAGGGADAGPTGDASPGSPEAGEGQAPLELSPSTTPISAGGSSACAIDPRGGVVCWGDNVHGELGAGSMIPTSSAVPVPVSGLAVGVRAVSGGPLAACAILDDGSARCWGRSLFGEIGGAGTTEGVNVPYPHDKTGLSNDVARISFGFDFVCALTRTGRAKCWGLGGAGQLGNGSTGDAYAARDVAMGDARYVDVSASMGGFFACAVAADGSVSCWGKNDEKQLGVADAVDHPKPSAVSGLPLRAIKVGAGRAHACAILEDGGVACWGGDGRGQMGRGEAGPPSAPRRVDGVSGAKDLAVGADHACAILTTGAVLCWGSNDAFQIAAGAERTVRPTEIAPASFGAVGVAGGIVHTCVMDAGRHVRCIGANDRGQRGPGDFTL